MQKYLILLWNGLEYMLMMLSHNDSPQSNIYLSSTRIQMLEGDQGKSLHSSHA